MLHADGSVKFNYTDITSGDGIAGLFPNVVRKGDMIARVVDGTNPELPGHLDLLDVAVYESSTESVIAEFTMRDPIRDPGDGTVYTYRLYFDTDEPHWTEYEFGDEDFALAINVNPGGGLTTWHGTALESEAANRPSARRRVRACAHAADRPKSSQMPAPPCSRMARSMTSRAMLGATTLIIAISARAALLPNGVHAVGGVQGKQPRLLDPDPRGRRPPPSPPLVGEGPSERHAGLRARTHLLERPLGQPDEPHAVLDAARP